MKSVTDEEAYIKDFEKKSHHIIQCLKHRNNERRKETTIKRSEVEQAQKAKQQVEREITDLGKNLEIAKERKKARADTGVE